MKRIFQDRIFVPTDKLKSTVQDGSAKDNDFGVFGSSIVFTRLEDITLLRAEALCALNRSTEAVSYLNMVRTNRGLREVSFKKDFGNNRESLIADGQGHTISSLLP